MDLLYFIRDITLSLISCCKVSCSSLIEKRVRRNVHECLSYIGVALSTHWKVANTCTCTVSELAHFIPVVELVLKME